MSPKDIGVGQQFPAGTSSTSQHLTAEWPSWGVGQHVLVHLVRLIDWDFTSPKDPPIRQLTPYWPSDELYFAKYFPPWDPSTEWSTEVDGEAFFGDFSDTGGILNEDSEEEWTVTIGEKPEDCWHCGWPWSARHRCPAWGVRCHRCGLPNHYARMCRTGAAGSDDNNSSTTITDLQTDCSLTSNSTVTNCSISNNTDEIGSFTTSSSNANSARKKPHRKRKKTAKQRKRDQERLQRFLEKKALEQQLIEQGLDVQEIAEILSTVASSSMVEKLTQQGEWDEETLKTRMDQLPEHAVAMATTTHMTTGSTSSNTKGDDTLSSVMASHSADVTNMADDAQRPSSLESTPKKRIVPNMDLLQDDPALAHASASSSEEFEAEPLDSFNDLHTPEDLNTPEILGDSIFEGELDWEDNRKPSTEKGDISDETPVDPIPEYTAKEEFEDEKNWRSVTVGDRQFRIDMKVIEPYKKVLSHGGYYGDGFNAIIVFAGCYLPEKSRRDYHYVMDNLFLYVLSTLELLVVEDYMVVYFHGATPKQKMPSLRWLKRCYEMIDRRLRKNLKSLLIVHPTLWLKTIMTLTKPFISSKFTSKLKYVRGLKELADMVPMEYIFVPDEIKICDEQMEVLEQMSKSERKAKEKQDKKAKKEQKKLLKQKANKKN